MKQIIKSIYGKIALLKAFCPNCKAYSFIQDGFYICCDLPYENIPEKEITKRESEGQHRRSLIPRKLKKQILEKQNHKCIYCDMTFGSSIFENGKFRKVKIHIDHFVSWNYSRDNCEYNLVAACSICNSIKSDKYFYDLISARDYILERRKLKNICQTTEA